MKRIHLTLVLLTVFFVAAFATAASANTAGSMEINAGYAKSSTDVTGNNESMGGGIAFGAGYWRNASPTVQWGAEASWDNLGSVDYTLPGPVTGTLKSNIIRINPALRANFGSKTGPSFFAQGGAGLYSMSFKDQPNGGAEVKDTQSKFGFNLGAGVGFPVGPKTNMNFLGQYHSISTEGQSTNYIEFKAGVGFGL
jgi:Outer membrane protein beta-barrel domain